MNRFSICIVLIFIAFQTAHSQMKEELPKLTPKERFYWGADLDLQIEGNTTLLELAPSIGYRLCRTFSLGLRFPYEFNKQNRFTEKIYSHNIAIRGFSNIIFIDDFSKVLPVKSKGGLMFQAEYEMLSFNNKYNTNRSMNDVFLTGIGLYQKTGKRSSFYISLMFSFSKNQYVYYKNPLIRFGFTF